MWSEPGIDVEVCWKSDTSDDTIANRCGKRMCYRMISHVHRHCRTADYRMGFSAVFVGSVRVAYSEAAWASDAGLELIEVQSVSKVTEAGYLHGSLILRFRELHPP